MNGQAIKNATIQINMKTFMRRSMKHFVIPSVVNATRKPNNNQVIERS
jgi:hypothetical protein